MACGSTAKQRQHSNVMSGETLEDPSQDTTHSTRDLLATEEPCTNSHDPDMESQANEVFDTDGPFLELLRTQEDMRPNTDTKDYTPNTALKNDAPVKKKRITWPKITDRHTGKELDEDNIPETTLQGAELLDKPCIINRQGAIW